MQEGLTTELGAEAHSETLVRSLGGGGRLQRQGDAHPASSQDEQAGHVSCYSQSILFKNTI